MKRLVCLLTFLLLLLPAAAQSNKDSFQRFYDRAQNFYKKEQYNEAISVLQNALQTYAPKNGTADPALAQLVKDANRLIEDCRLGIKRKNRLSLSKDTLVFGPRGGLDTIFIDAGQPSRLKAQCSAPAKCKVDTLAKDFLTVCLLPNPQNVAGKFGITLIMGSVKKQITVLQEARPLTKKQVSVHTVPSGARISINGKTQIGSWEGILTPDTYTVSIEKDGFKDVSKVLDIPDDEREDAVIRDTVHLTRNFASITLEIVPEAGFSFNEDYPLACRLNGNLVVDSGNSYDYDRRIQYYQPYQDGTIPVFPGTLNIRAEAPHFHSLNPDPVRIQDGDTLHLRYEMKAIAGYLSLVDAGQADDARVLIDGKDRGTVRDITHLPILEGEHRIELRKPGFLAHDDFYLVNIRENMEQVVPIRMDRYKTLVVDSNPQATVYVNGENRGRTCTKPFVVLDTLSVGKLHIELHEKGHMSCIEDHPIDFSSPATDTLRYQLVPGHRLIITADKPDMLVTVRRQKGQLALPHLNNKPVPDTTILPWSPKRYYMEMRYPGSNRKAYKGYFSFKENSKDKVYILTWSHYYAQLLQGNYFLYGSQNVCIGEPDANGQRKLYRNMGYAGVLNFRFIDGLSTSFARAALFMGTDKNVQAGQEDISNYQYLPAISVLAINGDFRVGGSPLHYMDVCALISYAWYPDIFRKLLGFSHVSGHDLFIGAEVSSHIPIFNIQLRAGYQMYPGLKAHLYNKNANDGSNDVSQGYTTYDMNVPGAFMLSVGFSLGSWDSKGNNILRLF